MSILFLISLGCGAAGLFLLLLGVIGRRITCPPQCRQCGYSLVGSPDAEQCPECGADLVVPGAVTERERKRRPRFAVGGGALLLFAFTVFMPGWYQQLTGVNVYRAAPTWLVLRFASSGNEPEAVGELLTRLNAGRLNGEQISDVIDAALTMQADASKPWDVNWGNIVETADGNGLVTAEQMARYAETAVASSATLEVRPRIRKGDPIPFRFRSQTVRLGDQGLWVRRIGRSLRIDDVEVKLHGSSGRQMQGGQRSGWYGSRAEWDARLDGIAPGRVIVTALTRYKVYRTQVYDDRTPPLYEGDERLKAAVTLTVAEEPTALFVTDESLRDAMAAAFTTGDQHLTYNGKEGWLNFTINVGDAPYASAFDVWLERDGKRWKAGPVHFGAHKQHGHGSSARIDEFTPEKVDVILEPSLDAAVNSVDRMTIWGERIVIRDVPVKRQ